MRAAYLLQAAGAVLYGAGELTQWAARRRTRPTLPIAVQVTERPAPEPPAADWDAPDARILPFRRKG